MSNEAALKRVNAIDDEANGAITVDESANYDARLSREMTKASEAVRKMFGEALEGPQQQVQFTQKTYEAIILTIAASMAHMSARMYLALDRRRALEQRVGALESAGIKYFGIWQRAMSYRKGSVVTFDGGAWIALRDTEAAIPSSDWQLMVRAGRDGRS